MSGCVIVPNGCQESQYQASKCAGLADALSCWQSDCTNRCAGAAGCLLRMASQSKQGMPGQQSRGLQGITIAQMGGPSGL